MEFTTRFELQSQATRLVENGPYAWGGGGKNGIVTLLDALFQETSPPSPAGHASPDYNSDRSQIYNVSSSRFTRRYWGNPG